jgi:hypothetical protein
LRRRGIHACAEVQLGKTSQAVGRATVAREPNVVVIGARLANFRGASCSGLPR